MEVEIVRDRWRRTAGDGSEREERRETRELSKRRGKRRLKGKRKRIVIITGNEDRKKNIKEGKNEGGGNETRTGYKNNGTKWGSMMRGERVKMEKIRQKNREKYKGKIEEKREERMRGEQKRRGMKGE